MKFIITQIIGFIAYSIIAYSFFKKDKKSILFIQIFAYIGFTIHYFLLSGLTGALCNLLGLTALVLIYYLSNDKKKNILTICLIPLIIAISIITYENIYSIFPIIATIISLLSFLLNDENKIRVIGIISAICWFVYAIIYKSYPAIVFEIVLIISTTISFIKNKKTIK